MCISQFFFVFFGDRVPLLVRGTFLKTCLVNVHTSKLAPFFQGLQRVDRRRSVGLQREGGQERLYRGREGRARARQDGHQRGEVRGKEVPGSIPGHAYTC